MATTTITALTAGTALSGTEVAPFDQSGATVKITATQIKTWTSASPTLVTPALGTPSSGTLTSCTGLPAAGVVGTAAILGANTFTALQTITQASANAGILASTGYSLTGTNATSMLDLAGTWNTSGNPVALKIAMTNTASGATSKFASFLAGASGTTEIFNINVNGNVTASGPSGTLVLSCSDGNGSVYKLAPHNSLRVLNSAGTGWVPISASRYYAPDAGLFSWASGSTPDSGVDTAVGRNAAGVVEVNNGTAGTYRDLKVRDIIINGATNLLKTSAALTDNAAAQTATLTNAPAAGNPTKWVRIDDNGTARFIPCW